MNLFTLPLADLVGMVISLLLTLGVFSYLLGDNVLFRLAIHIFIGAASGYAVATAWINVLWPQLVRPMLFGGMNDRLFLLLPLLLSILLLAKTTPRLAAFGSLPVAYLVGIAAATAIGGAVLGTIFPQTVAAMNSLVPSPGTAEGTGIFQSLNGLLVLVGTVTTLAYFHFGAHPRAEGVPQRGALVELAASLGQVFIALTFGMLFAGVYLASLAAFVERWQSILSFLQPLLGQ